MSSIIVTSNPNPDLDGFALRPGYIMRKELAPLLKEKIYLGFLIFYGWLLLL